MSMKKYIINKRAIEDCLGLLEQGRRLAFNNQDIELMDRFRYAREHLMSEVINRQLYVENNYLHVEPLQIENINLPLPPIEHKFE